MSRRKSRPRACPTDGKHAYATRRHAFMAANRGGERGVQLRVYRCPCGFFHLTSRPKGGRA